MVPTYRVALISDGEANEGRSFLAQKIWKLMTVNRFVTQFSCLRNTTDEIWDSHFSMFLTRLKKKTKFFPSFWFGFFRRDIGNISKTYFFKYLIFFSKPQSALVFCMFSKGQPFLAKNKLTNSVLNTFLLN